MRKIVPLEFDKYYHIYNRGNNREDIFFEEKNYYYFLSLLEKFILPIVEIFAYCLLKNHFHLLVKIKDEKEVQNLIHTGQILEEQRIPSLNLTGFKNLSGLSGFPSQQFSNFFNSYTKSINKAYHRTGALFQRPFGRIVIDTELYFIHLVRYIHFNPEKHAYIDDFRNYQYSSYKTCISDKPTKIEREKIIERFDDKENFVHFHSQKPNEEIIKDFIDET